MDAIGDLLTELVGLENEDVRAERHDVDDGALESVEPERGIQPAVVGCRRPPPDAQGLQPAEHRRQAPALRRDTDQCSLRAGPASAGQPGGGAGELGRVAIEQLEPAAGASGGVHRHACSGECFDVAQHRPLADLQLGGQLAGRDPPSPLQDEQQGDQPARAHRAMFAGSINS